jgi:flagellar protein FliO/FliZ
MIKMFVLFFCFSLCLLAPLSVAQENVTVDENNKIDSVKVESTKVEGQHKENEPLTEGNTPEVGKHVMANMNASSMILSLLMVLGLIIISALVLKRFNLAQQNSSQLKIIASLSLGTKEKVVVVQIGDQQLVLGVCSQQISLLKQLETPIDIQASKPLALSGNVLSFLQKNSIKTQTDSNTATSETTSKK